MLKHFPPEVLQVILSFVLGKDITLLWLCGSRKLNEKLSNRGGVREFDVTMPEPSIWPPILSRFQSLHKLRVKSKYDLGELQYLDLSPSLQALSLSFEGAASSLFDTLYQYPRLLIGLSSLEIQRHHQENLDKKLPHKMRKWFPNLTTLILTKKRTDNMKVVSNPSYYKFKPSSLPRKLEKLILSDVELLQPGRWPLNLTWLSIVRSKRLQSQKWMSLLPISMTTLENYGSSFDAHDFDWSQLPANLRSLRLQVKNAVSHHFSSLPSSLTLLDICDNDDHLSWYHVPSYHDPCTVKYLPPMLTSLNLRMRNGLSVAKTIAPLLPRSLTHFGPTDSIAWPVSVLPHLPPHLQNVVIRIENPAECPDWTLFPDLTKAHFRGLFYSENIVSPAAIVPRNGTMGYLSSLPRGVREVYLEPDTQWFTPKCCSFAQLPTTLTSLTITQIFAEGGPADAFHARHLARSLKHLRLECMYVQFDQEWYDSLPSGLRELRLSVPSFKLSKPLPCAHLRLLSVTYLSMQAKMDAFIKTLPRNLVGLILESDPSSTCNLKPEDIEFLPRSLKRLKIPSTKNPLVPSQCNFPPGLRNATVGDVQIVSPT